ncbi:MAG TPA: hypothetical protein VJB59_11390 [Bdellovibrionota bacterium]|nr:hypothetical protein [Bdellovibrionota bacterium]
MRFLTKAHTLSAALVLTWIFGSATSSAKIIVPPEHFSVSVQGKYETRWTKVFKDGPVWACQTDLLPYFEAKEEPLKDLDWQRLKKTAAAKDPGPCTPVILEDHRRGKTESITSCLENPEIVRFVKSVHKKCGRGLL